MNEHNLGNSHCHVRIPEGNIDNLHVIARKVKIAFVGLNAVGSAKGNYSLFALHRRRSSTTSPIRLWATIWHLKCPCARKTHKNKENKRSLCSFAIAAKLAKSEDSSPMQMGPIMSGELVKKKMLVIVLNMG